MSSAERGRQEGNEHSTDGASGGGQRQPLEISHSGEERRGIDDEKFPWNEK